MRLSELDPEFIRHFDGGGHQRVETMAEATGIKLLCPKCASGDRHWIICWSPVVPQSIMPKPGRWNMQGSGFDDLSLVAGSSSVSLTSGCRAHFMVANGEVKFV